MLRAYIAPINTVTCQILDYQKNLNKVLTDNGKSEPINHKDEGKINC
jgi:hypothetical protein